MHVSGDLANIELTLLTQALLQLPWLSLASIPMDTTGWWAPIVTASQLTTAR